MKKISILLLLFILSANVSAQAENYVGYKHKGVVYGEKLPNGVKDLGGGLLSNDEWGVSRFSKGKQFMLWLEKIISYDEEGVPDWEVKDVLIFDDLKKNQEFLFSYSSPCTINDVENIDMIVLAQFSRKTKTYKILKAWQVDFETEKFEPLTTENIKCSYSEP